MSAGWRAAVSIALGGVLFLCGAGTAAKSAWWHEAPLSIAVHDHAFHRVTANAIGCVVRVRLYFRAPASAYADPVAGRNRYRFRAEVRFSEGHRIHSEPFSNAEPGARVFAFSHDTGPEGCWAETPRKLRKVDVNACRGQRCTPEAFE